MFLFVFIPLTKTPYDSVFYVVSENADAAKVAVITRIKEKMKGPAMMEEFEREVLSNQIEKWEDAIRDNLLPSPYTMKSYGPGQVVETEKP